MDRFIHSRQGFTLIELLVVIAIISLLAAMVIPAIIGVDVNAHRLVDQNNMKQIMTMYLSDRVDHRQTWAFPRKNTSFDTNNNKQPLIDGSPCDSSGTDVTNVSMFTLAARNEINPDLFNSKMKGEFITGIANYKRTKEDSWTSADVAEWTSSAGAITTTDLPYALDWSAPKSSGTTRITIALRDPFTYKETVPVVYADGHAGDIAYDETTGAAINVDITPMDSSGAAVGGGVLDDIYTEAGDIRSGGSSAEPRHLWIGRGDRLTCHVK